MMAAMITNGYLLTEKRVRELNDAGLDHMQISIDNVMPDEVSKKSLKVLDKKLQILSQHALFHVNINSVLGGGIHNPEDALTVGKRASSSDFTSTVGIIHDGDGQLRPIGDRERAVFVAMKQFEKRNFSQINYYQDAIAHGRPSNWRCRAGRATCTSARTAWCTTVPSSAAILPSLWLNTRWKISGAST